MDIRTFILIALLGTATFAAYADNPPASEFTLHTNSFTNSKSLPTKYTCDGENISPELDWSQIPANTQTLALIVADPDAPSGTFYHWVLYNIPTSITSIPEGAAELPKGIMIGKNNWDKQQYNGPCPPSGSTHHYIFTLYALDSNLAIPNDVDAEALLKTMQGHIINTVNLTATYSRAK